MAIAVDSSTPARATQGAGTIATTASFTPPAGSVLVACTSMNTNSSSSGTVAISDSSSLTWTLQQIANLGITGNGGAATIHTAVVSTSAAMTVTATTTNNNGTSQNTTLKVYVLTGVNTSNLAGGGAVGGGSGTPITTTAFNALGSNSLAVAAATNWHTGTLSSTDLTYDAVSMANSGGISGYKTTGAAGTSITATLAGPTSTTWNWVVVEVLALVPVYAPAIYGTVW